MPGIIVATKHSQGKKDLGDLIFGHRRNKNSTNLLTSVETLKYIIVYYSEGLY